MSDPIADFLTRVRNSLHANKRWVDVPSSNLKKRIAYVLKNEDLINAANILKAALAEYQKK